ETRAVSAGSLLRHYSGLNPALIEHGRNKLTHLRMHFRKCVSNGLNSLWKRHRGGFPACKFLRKRSGQIGRMERRKTKSFCLRAQTATADLDLITKRRHERLQRLPADTVLEQRRIQIMKIARVRAAAQDVEAPANHGVEA